jgi:hypothetical protein
MGLSSFRFSERWAVIFRKVSCPAAEANGSNPVFGAVAVENAPDAVYFQ